ncbi:CBS domain-containing protein [bacterium]|nr:CBS domain-containing protein [bacterium]
MKTLTAQDIMVTEVLTAEKDWSVEHLAEFLVEHSISGAPVISENGYLEGVVSLMDIARNQNLISHPPDSDRPHDYYLDGELNKYSDEIRDLIDVKQPGRVLVKDIMTPVVFSVAPDTPVKQVADAMIRGRIHRVLVTDGKQLAGIITTLDMLRVIYEYG